MLHFQPEESLVLTQFHLSPDWEWMQSVTETWGREAAGAGSWPRLYLAQNWARGELWQRVAPILAATVDQCFHCFWWGGGRRCSSLTQTFIWDVSYSVVWKCKVFYVWCCIKTVSENISVEKKNQTMKLVSCYIPVRAKFGLNFGYRSNLSLSGTYFGQQKRMLEKSEVILSEA